MLKRLIEKATRSRSEPVTGISFWHPAALIGTFFGIGRIPFAPGTFGSLAGMFMAPLVFYIGNLLFHAFTPHIDRIVFIAGIFIFSQILIMIIGTWAANVYMQKTGTQDPGSIVIDEVLGSMVSFTIAIIFPALVIGIFAHMHNVLDYFSVVTLKMFTLEYCLPIFLLFRLFDIWKPWPISKIDREMKGGLGVMLDDVLAGIYAGLAADLVFTGYLTILEYLR